jgi:hypothetical protein
MPNADYTISPQRLIPVFIGIITHKVLFKTVINITPYYKAAALKIHICNIYMNYYVFVFLQ